MATITKDSPLIISVTGSSDIHHKAELAIMSITVSDTAPTLEKASTSIVKSVDQIQSMLGVKDLSQSGETNPGSGIAKWKARTIAKTEYVYTSSMSKSVFRVTTSFEITFRDFALLATWDSTLCNTPNTKVAGIQWTLTDATRQQLETEGRKTCAQRAMHKARDFAEGVGLERDTVRAVELSDKGTEATSTSGDRGQNLPMRAKRNEKGETEDGNTLVFANEEVRLHSWVTIKCVAC
jgi:uncharacterized protein YggE